VKKEQLFNSRRTDYSPMLLGDESDMLFITSTRNQSKGDEISGITGAKYADMFVARKDENKKWKQVEEIDSEINTDYDEGACCFSPDGKTMYFTRCSSDPDYPRYAEIWESTRSDASWASPKKCEISKDTLSSYAHPAVSPDGEWLYFVSDMPGGEGGFDIWRTRIVSSGFGGVENMGRPINTSGDEMFPTFKPTGELYFSSDGHPGMGGLDIFKATNDSISGWIVENQQFPLNSSADDFGMTFEGLHNRGFFCSSRNDGKGWEHIYSFEYPEILQTVTGWVYEKDGYELPEGLVYMVGNDGTNEKISVKGDGSFTQVVKPGVDYVFLGTCKGYLNVRQQLRVEPSEESEEYTLQFPLPPINIPVLIDNIFYEFDKATLTPESTESLDKLVVMLNENPNITIELSSHCDYRGNDSYNLPLSQRRAESVVTYLIEKGINSDRLTAVGYGE
jgi:outer membrane protein OmpA-like peptidoglycan-associated protein